MAKLAASGELTESEIYETGYRWSPFLRCWVVKPECRGQAFTPNGRYMGLDGEWHGEGGRAAVGGMSIDLSVTLDEKAWGDLSRSVVQIGDGKPVYQYVKGRKLKDEKPKLLAMAEEDVRQQPNFMLDPEHGLPALRLGSSIFRITKSGLFHGADRRLPFNGNAIARVGSILNASVEIPNVPAPWHYRIASVDFGRGNIVLIASKEAGKAGVEDIESLQSINVKEAHAARVATPTNTDLFMAWTVNDLREAWQDVFLQGMQKHVEEKSGEVWHPATSSLPSPEFAMDGTIVDALPAHLREDGRAIVAERAGTPTWMVEADGTPTKLSEGEWLRREAERRHAEGRFEGQTRYSIHSTLATGRDSTATYTDSQGVKRTLVVERGTRKHGMLKVAYKHCADFGTAWTGGFTLAELERYERKILNEGKRTFNRDRGRLTFKWKSPDGVTFTIGAYVKGKGKKAREVVNTVYTDRDQSKTKMLGTHFTGQAPIGQPSAGTLPRDGAQGKWKRRHQISGLYTGSAADYAQRDEEGNVVSGPSLHHVGSGEGSQVYGWGLYASDQRGVAEGYAQADRDRKRNRRTTLKVDVLFDGKPAREDNDLFNNHLRVLAQIEDYGGVEPVLKNFQFFKEHGGLKESDKADYDWLLANRDRISVRDVANVPTHLYEQTWFTNRATPEETERHLLKWYEPVSEEQKGWILAQLEKEWRGTSYIKEAIDEARTGQAVYELLAEELVEPEGFIQEHTQYGTGAKLGRQSASEFLTRAGIDGIKYPVDSYGGKPIKDGDKAGWNYVSFRDDNIRVDHKWTEGVERYQIAGALGAGRLGNRRLADAEEMERSGATREDIWRETGWWRGADGKWRVEIGDIELAADWNEKLQRGCQLRDLVSWDAIKAYDYEFGGVFVRLDPSLHADGQNRYTEIAIKPSAAKSADRVRSILAHEIQHSIQDVESFARGANSDVEIAVREGVGARAAFHDAMARYEQKAEAFKQALSGFVQNHASEWLTSLHGATIDEKGRVKFPYETKDEIPRINGRMIRSLGDIGKGVAKAMKKMKEHDMVRLAGGEELARILDDVGADELAGALRNARDEMRYTDALNETWADDLEAAYASELGGAVRGLLEADANVAQTVKPLDEAFKEGMKAYHTAGGEIEARNVQKRLKMTREERAATPPWETEDVQEGQAPAGEQKQAGTAYPDAGGEIGDARFAVGAKRREEYGRMLARKRPDLDAEKVLAELDKYGNPKKEKVALHWTVRGAIRLPEDEYKVDEALSVAEKAKVDPFGYASPMELIEAHKEFKPTAKAIDPDTVPELSDRREMGHGIVTYLVQDTREGQAAMRRIIDTHWGEDANPWCLLARQEERRDSRRRTPEYENWLGHRDPAWRSFYRPEWKEERDSKEYQQETGQSPYLPFTEEEALTNAWDYWQNYSALPKRVAFKDGKLLSFMATDGGYRYSRVGEAYMDETGLEPNDDPAAFKKWAKANEYRLRATEEWWDRQDNAHKGIPTTMAVPGDPLGRSQEGEIRDGEFHPTYFEVYERHRKGVDEKWDHGEYEKRETTADRERTSRWMDAGCRITEYAIDASNHRTRTILADADPDGTFFYGEANREKIKKGHPDTFGEVNLHGAVVGWKIVSAEGSLGNVAIQAKKDPDTGEWSIQHKGKIGEAELREKFDDWRERFEAMVRRPADSIGPEEERDNRDGRDGGERRYMVSPTLATDIAEALEKDGAGHYKKRTGAIIRFAKSIPIMDFLGVHMDGVFTTAATVRKMADRHMLTSGQIQMLVQANPAAVFLDTDGKGSHVILTDIMAPPSKAASEKPVMILLRPAKTGTGGYIASAYSRMADKENSYVLWRQHLRFVDENRIAGLNLEDETLSQLKPQASGNAVLTSSDYSKWSTYRSEAQSAWKVNGENARQAVTGRVRAFDTVPRYTPRGTVAALATLSYIAGREPDAGHLEEVAKRLGEEVDVGGDGDTRPVGAEGIAWGGRAGSQKTSCVQKWERRRDWAFQRGQEVGEWWGLIGVLFCKELERWKPRMWLHGRRRRWRRWRRRGTRRGWRRCG